MVLWRGVVYAILMCLAKLGVGIPILAYPKTISAATATRHCVYRLARRTVNVIRTFVLEQCSTLRDGSPTTPTARGSLRASEKSDRTTPRPLESQSSEKGHASTSMRPAAFIGIAMVSRGEIGLLIAQLARGTDGSEGLLGDEAFLVCIWAILLCTLVGPIGVGVVVKRWGPKVTSGIWA